MMRLLSITALSAAALLAVAAVYAPAEAQSSGATTTKKRVVVAKHRTRITVHKRSFLDPGPEVLPGDRHFTDYIYGPSFSPTAAIDGTMATGNRSPLPGPFDLPSRYNPWPY